MNNQLDSIDLAQLNNVTGGGLIGGIAKLGKKALPYVKKAGPWLGHKAVDAAKWTGIPSAVGAGAAWAKHQLDR